MHRFCLLLLVVPACAGPERAPRAGEAAPFVAGAAVAPALRLPRLLSDHMVLQRERDVCVWGWSAPNAEVEVAPSWTTKRARARGGADGRWVASVRTPVAGGPFTIDVRSNGDVKRIEDVLVGEVWLGSGQSNMEMWVGDVPGGYGGVKDWKAEVAHSDLPRLRLFDVGNAIAASPKDDVAGEWRVATPEAVTRFSATAFFFARALHAELGVPIGIVTADWGGTPAEAWTTEDSIAGHGGFEDGLAHVRRERERPGELAAEALRKQAAWWVALDARAPVSAIASLPTERWLGQPVPGLWKGESERFDGAAWCRRTVELPPEWRGRELVLAFGAIDDMDTAFVNGVEVGRTHAMGHWSEPREYRVPAAVSAQRFPTLELALRIVDTGGAGGTTGAREAFELRPSDVAAGMGLALAGEWSLALGARMSELGAFPSPEPLGPWMPSTLFHGMVAPLCSATFAGVIWYQGEANVGRAEQYKTLFPAMIESWRAAFGARELPFFFVQIAPFAYEDARRDAALLREAQLSALVLPNTGVAIAMDVGETDDIHPKDKRTVGERLARCALRRVHGREGIDDRGPECRGISIEGAEMRVLFDQVESLVMRGSGEGAFELAGEDRVFHPATARVDGVTLVVSSPLVKEPVAVRYAFRAASVGVLFDESGLPASSFQYGVR